MRNGVLLIGLCLGMIGCDSLPPFPETWQCAYSSKYNKFRCVNTKTKEKKNLRAEDPSMEGAQCVSIADYLKSEDWIDQVITIAKRKCK